MPFGGRPVRGPVFAFRTPVVDPYGTLLDISGLEAPMRPLQGEKAKRLVQGAARMRSGARATT
jgi:hypothetical protein